MTAPLSLVTGACGFAGVRMVKLLLEKGHRVIALDHPDACARDDLINGVFPDSLREMGVEPLAVDIANEPVIPVSRGVDYVFHTSEVFDYLAPWEVLEEGNVKTTRLLCEAVRNESNLKRIVVWGAPFYKILGPYELPYFEETPADPPNLYMKSKLFEERLVFQYHRNYELPVTVIRPAPVYGPMVVYGTGKLFRELSKIRILKVPQNFNMSVSWVHVDDVCRAAFHLTNIPEANGQAYNVADDTVMTYIDFVKLFAKNTGKKVIVAPPIPLFIARAVALMRALLGEWWGRHISHRRPRFERGAVPYYGQSFVYSNRKLKEIGFQFRYPDASAEIPNVLRWYRDNGLILRCG